MQIISTKNNIDKIIVNLFKNKSTPRCFCLPNNCSAPPLMAPESPLLLPSWSSTTVINAIQSMINNTIKMYA